MLNSNVTMDYKKIIQDIDNKAYYPVYFLYGDESFFIDRITKKIETTVLSESEKEFNQQILYGRDVDVPSLVNHAKRYPMMANHMVLIVREAQNIKAIETLQSYIEHPQESTLLVINYKYKTIDKRKTFYKVLQKKAVVFESSKLRDYAVPGWILQYVNEHGYKVSERNSVLLAGHLGNDLSKIANELSKVFISFPAGTEITADIIEANIGISKDFNIFELQDALGKKDIFKANTIISYFAANIKENPFPMIIGFLYAFYSKLFRLHFIKSNDNKLLAATMGVPPFFVKEYQSAAR
ncbi:MAG: DNA polymerase III subunit delta, partial [Bacteroidales bacterium]|nr:DNA polymerase III subunit delta [Bacteroidales bacterium]